MGSVQYFSWTFHWNNWCPGSQLRRDIHQWTTSMAEKGKTQKSKKCQWKFVIPFSATQASPQCSARYKLQQGPIIEIVKIKPIKQIYKNPYYIILLHSQDHMYCPELFLHCECAHFFQTILLRSLLHYLQLQMWGLIYGSGFVVCVHPLTHIFQ